LSVNTLAFGTNPPVAASTNVNGTNTGTVATFVKLDGSRPMTGQLTVPSISGLTMAGPMTNQFGIFANGLGITNLPPGKISIFTRDMTAASGSVAYTGVGFKPRMVFFLASPVNMPGASIGAFDDVNGTGGALVDLHVDVANSWYISSSAIYCRMSANNSQSATIASFDSDGFTLTWTKGGTPGAGNITVMYIAFR
jgi:hypothetical protein